MLAMITKLATSPVAAESALATSRMTTSGLARSRMKSKPGRRTLGSGCVVAAIALQSQVAASRDVRPSSVVPSSASSAAAGCCQNAVPVIDQPFTILGSFADAAHVVCAGLADR